MIKKKFGVTKPTLKFDLQRFDGETLVFPETLTKDAGAYLISSAEELQALATYVNADNDCSGTIKNLNLANVNVSGADKVGGLIGQNNRETFKANDFTFENGSVKNCTATATVTATGNFSGNVIGQDNNAVIAIYEITLPACVTVTCADADKITVGGTTYYKRGAELTFNVTGTDLSYSEITGVKAGEVSVETGGSYNVGSADITFAINGTEGID